MNKKIKEQHKEDMLKMYFDMFKSVNEIKDGFKRIGYDYSTSSIENIIESDQNIRAIDMLKMVEVALQREQVDYMSIRDYL